MAKKLANGMTVHRSMKEAATCNISIFSPRGMHAPLTMFSLRYFFLFSFLHKLLSK